MENTVSVQTLEFLYSALLGVGLGVIFDITRVIRSYIPKNRAVTAVFDIMFWIASIILLLAFVLIFSEGQMRWYVLFGAFCGGFVYMSALSEIVYKILTSLICAVRKILYLITRPIYLVLRWCWKVGKSAERKTETAMRERIKRNRIKRMKKRKVGKNGGKKTKKAHGLSS
ncbi:MAG: spore cortex biosynthesis protein YabQ [Oscillospiraceae bacterium]|nr:spore cortex biosynthesis protein YabQ [Oscillospiraceae bacterium]